MIGGWRWISGIRMQSRTHLIEYRCPTCNGIAQGYEPCKYGLEGVAPDAVREELGGFPYDLKVTAWRNGKGVDAYIFPEVLEKHCRALNGKRGPSAFVLFCNACHERSEFVGGDVPEKFWQIQTRHGVLWARNREHLVEIRNHIQLERRPQGFIKLPGWVIAAKNRDEIVKLINRALENS